MGSKNNETSLEIDLKAYRETIGQIFKHYKDCYGFIDYRRARPFVSELYALITGDLENMVAKGAYEPAFTLSGSIFDRLCRVQMDDSDGGLTDLSNVCVNLWNQILSNAQDAKLEAKMYRWFIKRMDEKTIDYMAGITEK